MNDIFLTIMADKKESGGGFDKTTDFKWFGIGLLVFLLIWVMPTPESMLTKAEELFGDLSPCLLYTSPRQRALSTSRMPGSA